MIGWLQGQLADRWQQASRCGLLLVCSGVGYEVQMPRRQWDQLGEAGSTLSLHIHQVIREDAWTLYGFSSRAERDLFRELVAVSGVGPQMALGLLGQLSCEELVRAIIQADLRLLTQAPGVGKRTAERLAVELRTRLQERYGSGGNPDDTADLSLSASAATPELANAVRDEVSLTLTALGYEALEINRALRAVAALNGAENKPEIETADDWLRECLRWLSRSQAA
ncbi:MAG: Holliday junction branch migration protein RuvA [Cyanobacteriota bacterium]